MRRFSGIAALVAALLFSGELRAATWVKTVAEAQAQAKMGNRLIFVDLFADWCGWCHRMEREVFPSETFQKATSKMVLLRLDTEDGAEGTRFSQQYAVQSLPTFLLLAPDMTLAGVIQGYAPAPDFVQKLKQVEGDYRSFLQRVKDEPKYPKDYRKRLELAAEFIGRHGWNDAEKRLTALTRERGVPNDIRDLAIYNLALLRATQQKWDQSADMLKKMLATASKGEAAEKGHVLLGQIYYQQGKYKASLDELKLFRRTFPDSPMIGNVDMMIPQVERAASAVRP